MNKTLIKLIDASLLPAAFMICGKVFGLWITNTIFELPWSIYTDANKLFSVSVLYETLSDQLIATSYSNLIMFVLVLLGFTGILFRALFFHSSHISPRMIARLATNNLLSLITDSFEIYYSASVWLVMMWISFFTIGINVILGRALSWTAMIAFLCTLFSSIILLRDVMHEINIAKNNINQLRS